MQRLHLVGFTTDHEGLILSSRRNARSGSHLLVIDAALEEAVDDLRARRAAEGDGVAGGTPATPRIESALPVREIQARLRQGRSIAEVAKAAGVDVAWVERFATPVLAERAQVISTVQAAPLRRARLGTSALPIGDAIRHHLADREVALSGDEFADAWSARQVADGRWAVRFAFRYRGRDQVLRFDLDEASGEVTTADRISGQLGFVAPTTPPVPVPEQSRSATPRPAVTAPESRPTVKRAVVSTGFRPQPATRPTSRSAREREKATEAMSKAAAKRAVEGERAAARKAKERQMLAAQQAREEKVAAAQAAREARAAQQAAEAAALAKAAAAKRAAASRSKPVARAKPATPAKASAPTAPPTRSPAKTAPTRSTAAPAPTRKPADPATAAPAVRKAPARPTAPAAVRRPSAASRPARPAASRATRPGRGAPTASPASSAPRPVSATSPAPAVRTGQTPPVIATPRSAHPTGESVAEGAGIGGAAANVYGTTSARALFRRGLVEQASGGLGSVADGAAPAPSNGSRPEAARPRPDRPRRTRQLRAT